MNLEGLNEKKWFPILKIIIGNVFMGFAYAKWMKPDAIINGGVTSVAMILNKATQIPILYLTNGVTLILLFVCWYYLGKQNFLQSIVSSVAYNGFFSLFYLIPINFQMNIIIDFLLASLFIAFGYYCCISANASTVGMDVIALIAHKKNPKVNIAKTIRLINFVVLGFGFLVYGVSSVIIGIAFSYANSYLLNIFLKHDKVWLAKEAKKETKLA